MLPRQQYAIANRDRYYDWLDNVKRGPYTILDRIEFAVVSAHTPMKAAIQGWSASRNVDDMTAYANALNDNGVLASFNKAGYVWRLREMLRDNVDNCPAPDYKTFRRTHKLPGLGWSKVSFAACLIDPFYSTIVCLDTHILETYMREKTAQDKQRVFRRLDLYETIENRLLIEAGECAMVPFAYQWAVWDYQRMLDGKMGGENHSFLWDVRNSRFQLPLFSGTIT